MNRIREKDRKSGLLQDKQDKTETGNQDLYRIDRIEEKDRKSGFSENTGLEVRVDTGIWV